MQDVSIVLSSEEYKVILENVAAQCSAKFSLLPTVTSMSPKTESQEHSQNGKAGMISNLAAEVGKFPIQEGNVNCISCISSKMVLYLLEGVGKFQFQTSI